MSNVIDINQDQFVEEVVEKSKTIPVIVDFWAPWCGPCKQLTPVLESIVNKKNGKIILAKINVDENQAISAQLKIQSIPTVYGFVEGRPIDAFQGAQPESKIESMIDKLIDATPGNEIPKLLEEADTCFKNQDYEKAQNLYENLIALDPGNIKIIAGLLRTLLQLKKFEDINEMLDSLDKKILEDSEINKIKKLMDNLHGDENSSSINELQNKLNKNPNDKNIRLELSVELLKSNQTDRGFKELLLLYEQDPKWNEEAAKKKLLEYFDLLGFNDPNVVEARKKLSSIMFK